MFSPTLQRALDDARSGKLGQAITDVRRVLTRQPRDVNALLVLSILLMQDGQVEQAAHHLARGVELAPDSPQARSNYAGALMHLGRSAQAAEQLRRAVALAPTNADLWMNLASALLEVPDPQGAVDAARRGLLVAPGSPTISLNLAMALQKLGKPEEGLDIAERAHRGHPGDVRLHSQYLLMLNSAEREAASIAAAHREFGVLHPTVGAPAATDPDPERQLRIGWLSADLRTHSVAFFAEALLAHAPAWVHTTVFAIRPDVGDPITKRLRGEAQGWCPVGHLDEAALNRVIREQRIDILIETSGHTGDNRLGALARKPAPLIISAIGYPNTTGLPAIDLRLADAVTDPPGSESLATERLLRVHPCFLCYRPHDAAPEPEWPDGPITFGSFNALHKIGPATANLWRAVLDRLTAAGIGRDRVEVLRGTPTVAEHLRTYGRVHIALDTTPYNGTTTTCEALWMGVPVVSLAGDRHAARVGASLLAAAGHPEWVAESPAKFIHIAAELAGDVAHLRSLRAGLRAAVKDSALCDAPMYASKVYSAMREQWREYCRHREAKS